MVEEVNAAAVSETRQDADLELAKIEIATPKTPDDSPSGAYPGRILFSPTNSPPVTRAQSKAAKVARAMADMLPVAGSSRTTQPRKRTKVFDEPSSPLAHTTQTADDLFMMTLAPPVHASRGTAVPGMRGRNQQCKSAILDQLQLLISSIFSFQAK